MKTKITLLTILMIAFVQFTYAQATNKPDLGAIIRQFHMNYSNGEVEKNGALVDDNVIIDINGGSANQPNLISKPHTISNLFIYCQLKLWDG